MQTLHQLARLKKQILRSRRFKDAEQDKKRKAHALANIDRIIAKRQGPGIWCALPKKKQRAMGLLPPVGSYATLYFKDENGEYKKIFGKVEIEESKIPESPDGEIVDSKIVKKFIDGVQVYP